MIANFCVMFDPYWVVRINLSFTPRFLLKKSLRNLKLSPFQDNAKIRQKLASINQL